MSPTQTISRCGGGSGGSALYETLIVANVKALYKLDETSGNTAADSSGNGYDATTYGSRVAPLWGQTTAPTGTTSAYFSQAGTLHGLRNLAFPSLTSDWTILGWFRQDGDVFGIAASQGDALANGSTGFGVGFNSSSEVPPSHGWVYVGNGGGFPTEIASSGVLAPATWYMLAATRSGTTVQLYVNGAATGIPATPAYAATTGTWLGNNGAGFGLTGWASWIGYFDTALTAAQIGAIYTAASL